MEENKVRRPVRLADFAVIGAGLIHNLIHAFQVASEELLEISIYNSNRETELNKVWENFSTDLEKITEDNDGA
jgi:hypothetical protein